MEGGGIIIMRAVPDNNQDRNDPTNT